MTRLFALLRRPLYRSAYPLPVEGIDPAAERINQALAKARKHRMSLAPKTEFAGDAA